MPERKKERTKLQYKKKERKMKEGRKVTQKKERKTFNHATAHTRKDIPER